MVLSFCDDGPEFDPTTYQPEEKEEFAIDNIVMLRAVSKDIKYQRVIVLTNKTVVFFEGRVRMKAIYMQGWLCDAAERSL